MPGLSGHDGVRHALSAFQNHRPLFGVSLAPDLLARRQAIDE
jgi:hypothetical protein